MTASRAQHSITMLQHYNGSLLLRKIRRNFQIVNIVQDFKNFSYITSDELVPGINSDFSAIMLR